MTCVNSQEWLASGTAQMDAAKLSGPARTQATLSLRLSNPFVPHTAQLYSGPINRNMPYFLLGVDGCPQLVIPSPAGSPIDPAPPTPEPLISPAPSTPTAGSIEAVLPSTGPAPPPAPGVLTLPAGQPCPEGFVSSGAPITTTEQLSAEVVRQLTGGAISSATEGGACNPQIVLAPQQLMTKDDFVVVSCSSIFVDFGSTTGTVPLTVTVRLLTCTGSIQVMQSTTNIFHDQTLGATQAEVCIPLTDGYLLSVVASGAPFCTQPGDVWVQGEIRSGGCSGTPYFGLFSGYLVDQSFIGWPNGRQDTWGQGAGSLHGFDMKTCNPVNPCWVPELGTRTRILQVGLDFTTSAVVGNRTPVLCWNPPVNGCDLYFGVPVAQPASKHYYWTWADGIAPGSMLANVNTTSGSGLLDAIVQIPFPTKIIGTGDAELRFLIGGRDFAGDVINFAGVNYEVWAEPADAGF